MSGAGLALKSILCDIQQKQREDFVRVQNALQAVLAENQALISEVRRIKRSRTPTSPAHSSANNNTNNSRRSSGLQDSKYDGSSDQLRLLGEAAPDGVIATWPASLPGAIETARTLPSARAEASSSDLANQADVDREASQGTTTAGVTRTTGSRGSSASRVLERGRRGSSARSGGEREALPRPSSVGNPPGESDSRVSSARRAAPPLPPWPKTKALTSGKSNDATPEEDWQQHDGVIKSARAFHLAPSPPSEIEFATNGSRSEQDEENNKIAKGKRQSYTLSTDGGTSEVDVDVDEDLEVKSSNNNSSQQDAKHLEAIIKPMRPYIPRFGGPDQMGIKAEYSAKSSLPPPSIGQESSEMMLGPTMSDVARLRRTTWKVLNTKTGQGGNISILDERRRVKEQRRIYHIFRLDKRHEESSRKSTALMYFQETITPEMLVQALHIRDPELKLRLEIATRVVEAFVNIESEVLGFDAIPNGHHLGVSVAGLVEILWMSDWSDYFTEDLVAEAWKIVRSLRMPTDDEIVHEAARGGLPAQEVTTTTKKRGFAWYLNLTVSIVVVLNMLAMGVSIDYYPDALGWFIFEIICTFVFFFEMSYWIRVRGCKEYFYGEACHWNITDVVITMIAILQVLLECATRLSAQMGSGQQVAEAGKVTIFLRALRAVRVLRLIKMVRSPLLRDLANMLVGFLIGIPSLFWVLVMFVLVLCLFGLFFRNVFGPTDITKSWIDLCGYGDDLTDFTDPDCRVAYVYGEEFFGTVGLSMFTCFRFMLGDYSTRGGKSIVVAFSQDYGALFDCTFTAWMITVIFGIFNIITAIFVDTTVAGLKHNDIKRKHAAQYEREFVRTKLTSLLERIHQLDGEHSVHVDWEGISNNTEITEEQFNEIVADSQIQLLLQDLDVDTFNLPAIFRTFDGDDSGHITLQDVMEGIMKLRGEPQKTDVVGCWVSTKMLHEKLDELKTVLESDRIQARPSSAPS